MKIKNVHYESVHIETNVLNNDGRVKIEVYEFPALSDKELIAEFWIPATSVLMCGNSFYVPKEIIKARCKAIGFTFDHNSATYK